MDSKIKERVKAVLTEYLVANKCRKTPERYAILDAIYDQRGQFTLEELTCWLRTSVSVVQRSITRFDCSSHCVL